MFELMLHTSHITSTTSQGLRVKLSFIYARGPRNTPGFSPLDGGVSGIRVTSRVLAIRSGRLLFSFLYRFGGKQLIGEEDGSSA